MSSSYALPRLEHPCDFGTLDAQSQGIEGVQAGENSCLTGNVHLELPYVMA